MTTSRTAILFMVHLLLVVEQERWQNVICVFCRRCEIFDGFEEFLRADRFTDIGIHAGIEAALAVSLHRITGHGDDRDVVPGGLFLLSDGSRRLETVHL